MERTKQIRDPALAFHRDGLICSSHSPIQWQPEAIIMQLFYTRESVATGDAVIIRKALL